RTAYLTECFPDSSASRRAPELVVGSQGRPTADAPISWLSSRHLAEHDHVVLDRRPQADRGCHDERRHPDRVEAHAEIRVVDDQGADADGLENHLDLAGR